jgi:hypothetical protein
MFDLQWHAIIQGIAFMSQQVGSFVDAYGGGLIYDMLGSYALAGASERRRGLLPAWFRSRSHWFARPRRRGFARPDACRFFRRRSAVESGSRKLFSAFASRYGR